MTTHEEIRAQLDDFVDGQLKPQQAAEVTAHAESCPACALELKALRSLLTRAHELPGELEPKRDLWPQLASRLDEAPVGEPARVLDLEGTRPAASGANSLLSLRSATWLLAAVLAFALLVSPTLRGLHPQAPSVRGGGKDMLALCSDSMIRDTRTVFAKHRGNLSPATELVLDQSLSQIQQALRETVAAMNETDVNSPEYRSLAAGYRNKLDLLQRIAVQTNAL